MAGRRWNDNSIARQIIEAARTRADAASRAPLSDDLELLSRLGALEAMDLQSLVVRLSGYAWKRRLYSDDLLMVSRALAQASASTGNSLPVPQRAFVSVVDDVLRALLYGDDGVVPRAQPWEVEQRAREAWRPPVEDRSVIDARFVRSILEPLLAGDRAAFRALLGAIGKELVSIAARGVDGRLPNVTSLLAYQQLRALQGALNGILQASRAGARVAGGVEAAV